MYKMFLLGHNSMSRLLCALKPKKREENLKTFPPKPDWKTCLATPLMWLKTRWQSLDRMIHIVHVSGGYTSGRKNDMTTKTQIKY